MKGKGRQGSGGKSSWGEARGGKGMGKPREAMEAWARGDATWSGWEASVLGKGHAENAPWTTSQNTNDDQRWGPWPGTQSTPLVREAPPSMAEGKGHDENAPWTTYSQNTNEGNWWGHW